VERRRRGRGKESEAVKCMPGSTSPFDVRADLILGHPSRYTLMLLTEMVTFMRGG
jgi:hypothetical protein